jgi:hypothetical protein
MSKRVNHIQSVFATGLLPPSVLNPSLARHDQ